MLSQAPVRRESISRPPPAGAKASDESARLRTELDALNAELREMPSTDVSLRAYLETWAALLSLSVAGKMTWDWLHTASKAPVFGFLVGALGVYFVVHSLLLRARARRMSAHEETRLRRQRELRALLGLEEAPVPPMPAAPAPALHQ